MQKLSQLKQQSIKAARELKWDDAIHFNNEILKQYPKDLEAMNRLGSAHMQKKDLKEAKKVFDNVISIDKSNIIANKHLKSIKKNQVTPAIAFSKNNYFIEEPGKTKIIELRRLATKETLSTLCCGQECNLIPKNRFISIESDSKKYIGALPEDISFRLTKLINTGNTYECSVQSCSDKKCSVNIKEVCRSKKNCDVQSFPVKIT